MKLLLPSLCVLFQAAAVLAETSDQPSSQETEHLDIRSVEGVSPDAVKLVAEHGEAFFEDIRSLLGDAPSRKIPILLEGPAESPDRPSRGYPHVDSFGQIHLFQFGGHDSSYLSPLAHEMVHVFRFDRRREADWFFEEGFAEFIALTVDPSLSGFPWYDTPVEIAAGQWIASGEDLSLQELRADHKSLNLPCKAQSYTLRSSYFRYLGDTYGQDAILEMAIRQPAGTLSDYELAFGKNFTSLETEWRASLLDTYRSIDGAEAKARRYRQDTPIQYMPVCGSKQD